MVFLLCLCFFMFYSLSTFWASALHLMSKQIQAHAKCVCGHIILRGQAKAISFSLQKGIWSGFILFQRTFLHLSLALNHLSVQDSECSACQETKVSLQLQWGDLESFPVFPESLISGLLGWLGNSIKFPWKYLMSKSSKEATNLITEKHFSVMWQDMLKL